MEPAAEGGFKGLPGGELGVVARGDVCDGFAIP